MLLDIIRQFGLPTPVRNFVVRIDGKPEYELDLAYPDQLIDLEANGAKWHSTRRQRKRDAERHVVLKALGWHIEDFDYDEVVYYPESVAARIGAVLCGSVPA